MTSDWFTLWPSLLLVVVVAVFVWWRRCSRYFARRGVPHIPPLPFVGNMLDTVLGKRALPDVLTELYNKLEPHPYAGIFLFTTPVLMVRDSDHIRAVTVKDFDSFTDHIPLSESEKVNPLLGRILFTLKGEKWHEMRSTLSPAYTTMRIKNMFSFISETGQQMVEHLARKTAEHGGEILTLDTKDLFTRVANDVIANTAFGLKVDSLSEPNNTFYTMGYRATNIKPLVGLGYLLSLKLMEWLGIPLTDKTAVDFFRSTVENAIRTREKQGIIRPDMIHLMMQAQRGALTTDEKLKNNVKENENKPVLTDDDVVAQAFIFFFAGFDTVSTLLVFCCHLLAMHEDVQRRLQQEVDEVMQISGGQPSYEQLMGCQYLDMVISEALRLYPPAIIMDRVCVRPYRLPATETCPGFELKPGDAIWVPVHSIHRDPKYYPDPERFDPERFSPENKHLIQPFTYHPFGSGPRFCIGQRFALMEAKIVLLHLLARFSLHVVPKTTVPLQLDPSQFVTLGIKGGAWLGITKRE